MTLGNVLQKYSGADNEGVSQKKLFENIFSRAGNNYFFLSVGGENYYHRRRQSPKTSKRAGREFDIKSTEKF